MSEGIVWLECGLCSAKVKLSDIIKNLSLSLCFTTNYCISWDFFFALFHRMDRNRIRILVVEKVTRHYSLGFALVLTGLGSGLLL